MKLLILLLFTTIAFGQNSIVVSGNENYTIGETFPIMQQVDTIIEVSLGVPSYEFPTPKPIIKKKPKSFFEKLIEFFKNLINKKQKK